MKLFILLLTTNVIFATESYFRQNQFKKSRKISSRSVTIDGELLKQSYDEFGNLRLEVYSKGRINESICFDSKKQKFFSNKPTDSERYFECISEYSLIINNNGGELEEPPRDKQKQGDLNFSSRGKNLNSK